MNIPLYSLIVLIYFNAIWQTIVWGYDLVHPVFGFLLVFFFPVFAGIAVYLALHDKAPDGLLSAVLISTILFPVFYCVSYATRAPDYVKFIHSRGDVFAGRVSELSSGQHLYYTFGNALVKPGEFGAAYERRSAGKNSSSRYSKYFVIPVQDADTLESKNVWLCSSVSKGIPIDNGAAGPYGLDQTGLQNAAGTGILHGRRITESNCLRAVSQYLAKTGLTGTGTPLLLNLEKEPAAEYYQAAKIHFWILTGSLNAFFIVIFAFVYRASKSI